MKIILSRKGFDSESGGYPSPTLPDGRMISLPIPSENDCFHYQDLKLDNKTYFDLMKELGINGDILNTPCHVDPDICKEVISRPEKWKHLFGQRGAAQGHLDKQNIQDGDIFLFFGTFQKTKEDGGKIKFDSNNKPKHVIFGYLQIGEIIKNKKDVEDCMKYHSHYNHMGDWDKNNTIYVARESLSWNSKIPGAGVFRYNKNLVLSAEGHKKSIWNLPILNGKKISYHNENSWKNGLFQSVGRGQEFVIEDDKEVENWAKDLIEMSS